MDHGIKDDLIEGIEILLGDNANLVLGSAVAAFCEVCPERIDLIHPHFRKLCNTLIDIDEWGQITILNMMARYVRNQFGNPNPNSSHVCFSCSIIIFIIIIISKNHCYNTTLIYSIKVDNNNNNN